MQARAAAIREEMIEAVRAGMIDELLEEMGRFADGMQRLPAPSPDDWDKADEAFWTHLYSLFGRHLRRAPWWRDVGKLKNSRVGGSKSGSKLTRVQAIQDFADELVSRYPHETREQLFQRIPENHGEDEPGAYRDGEEVFAIDDRTGRESRRIKRRTFYNYLTLSRAK